MFVALTLFSSCRSDCVDRRAPVCSVPISILPTPLPTTWLTSLLITPQSRDLAKVKLHPFSTTHPLISLRSMILVPRNGNKEPYTAYRNCTVPLLENLRSYLPWGDYQASLWQSNSFLAIRSRWLKTKKTHTQPWHISSCAFKTGTCNWHRQWIQEVFIIITLCFSSSQPVACVPLVVRVIYNLGLYSF